MIAKVSGESYCDYVGEPIYGPAGMHATGSQPEEPKIPNLSVGYTRYGTGRLHPDTDVLPWRGGPEGGGYSTVDDLLAFATALHKHRLLDAPSTQLLTTGKIDMPINGRYAYGLMDHRSAGVQCVGHAGAWPGTSSDFEMCLGSRYVYAVLANMDPPAAEEIGFFIGNRVTQSGCRLEAGAHPSSIRAEGAGIDGSGDSGDGFGSTRLPGLKRWTSAHEQGGPELDFVVSSILPVAPAAVSLFIHAHPSIQRNLGHRFRLLRTRC